jgi:hypothetical protein
MVGKYCQITFDIAISRAFAFLQTKADCLLIAKIISVPTFSLNPHKTTRSKREALGLSFWLFAGSFFPRKNFYSAFFDKV